MFKFVVIATVLAAANAGIIQSGWSTPVVAQVAHHGATSWQNNNQISVNPVVVKSVAPVVHAVHAPIAVAHAPVAVVSSHGGWNNGWNGGAGWNNGGWNNGGWNGGAGWNNGGWNNGGWNHGGW